MQNSHSLQIMSFLVKPCGIVENATLACFYITPQERAGVLHI
jgi:hypothetical protein